MKPFAVVVISSRHGGSGASVGFSGAFLSRASLQAQGAGTRMGRSCRRATMTLKLEARGKEHHDGSRISAQLHIRHPTAWYLKPAKPSTHHANSRMQNQRPELFQQGVSSHQHLQSVRSQNCSIRGTSAACSVVIDGHQCRQEEQVVGSGNHRTAAAVFAMQIF